jgi:hypothetical protein
MTPGKVDFHTEWAMPDPAMDYVPSRDEQEAGPRMAKAPYSQTEGDPNPQANRETVAREGVIARTI